MLCFFKKNMFFFALFLIASPTYAALELKHIYNAWEHYESPEIETGKPIILGVSEAIDNNKSKAIVLRCTTEGLNLLFLKSLPYEKRGYQANASVDSTTHFEMDVWVKGTTHWATIPTDHIPTLTQGSTLSVVLSGDNQEKERITLSLKGFDIMYKTILPSCQ